MNEPPMSVPPVSVKGVVIRDGSVLLLLNERGEWDLPGGRPDPGEDRRAALEREVREETGLEVEVVAALAAYLFEVLPGRFVRIEPFACCLVGKRDAVLSHEHLELRWQPLSGLGEVIAGHPLPAGYLAAIKASYSSSPLGGEVRSGGVEGRLQRPLPASPPIGREEKED